MKTTDQKFRFANYHAYSDVEPYEIVNDLSDRVKEVRAMKTSDSPLNAKELVFIPGGFSAHCVNQHAQRWQIESDPENTVIKIRLHKNGQWYDRHHRHFILAAEPCKFYDYNF